MVQIQLFVYFVIAIVLTGLLSVASSKPISCDVYRRNETCPSGFCCSRDEFLPLYTECRPIGKINDSCSPVPDFSICHCGEGLICVSNVHSGTFASVYGTCLPNSTTTDAPPPLPTAVTATTVKQAVTPLQHTTVTRHYNHPPIIQLHEKEADVSKYANIGDVISTFSVQDNGPGEEGVVKCSLLQLAYFTIKETGRNEFQIVVASSLRDLLPQKLSDFIMCQDGDHPPANGIVQFFIEIKDRGIVASSTTEMGSSSNKMSRKPTTKDEVSTDEFTETDANTETETKEFSFRPSSTVSAFTLSKEGDQHTVPVNSIEQNLFISPTSEYFTDKPPTIAYGGTTTESNFVAESGSAVTNQRI